MYDVYAKHENIVDYVRIGVFAPNADKRFGLLFATNQTPNKLQSKRLFGTHWTRNALTGHLLAAHPAHYWPPIGTIAAFNAIDRLIQWLIAANGYHFGVL
ncbi:unnamed protein product [Oppiella nova]|uniref:Uncharacterized protein n=1 Tax=Oppiella nova TaxID=334625 RepID=A0A7R9MJI5_9ACAR|nr:unnamed protein product [Oppiella nova]CAG2178559.1 unnamed protein product [Oppiella nova]